MVELTAFVIKNWYSTC